MTADMTVVLMVALSVAKLAVMMAVSKVELMVVLMVEMSVANLADWMVV